VIKPNPNYRPNPNRAIYVQGEINQALIDRLTPEIISLKSLSFEAITVYIDSPGGNIALMETLLQLLTASDQDLNPSGKLVSVVTSRAGSAAADLLSYGDYALAYPGTSIVYHGSRFSHQLPLTTEYTSLLMQFLRETNDKYATKLAREIVDRFMFRFISAKNEFKDEFEEIRNRDPKKTELDCFLTFVSGELSEGAKRVVASAKERYGRYDLLLDTVIKKARRIDSKTQAEFEAHQIKAIVDFELRKNKKNEDWNFEKGGLDALTDDFFILHEYLNNYASGFFEGLCNTYGRWWLSREDDDAFGKLSDDEREDATFAKVEPLLLPVWSFFVALCHALQHGENELTARDAIWLGLIDEILGEEELPCRRMAWEYKPDEQGEKSSEGDEKAAATSTARA
jgi:ATP-dependent protease ClpP protease subunit